MLEYLYPVVLFHGDDPDDCEVRQHRGTISIIQLKSEPYEINVNANGSSFHVLFGHHQNGWFLCIPNWNYGCELAHPADVFWNMENMTSLESQLAYEDTTAIVYALKTINNSI